MNQFRQSVIKISVIAFLAAAAWNPAAAAAPEQSAGKMNYIFLFTDDQGWGDLASFGHPVLKTPNFDRLVESGCKVNQMVVASPICAPSRAAAMTGRIPNRFGMNYIMGANSFAPMTRDYMTHVPLFHQVPRGEPMLPRELKRAGYATGHIGKWHLSMLRHRDKGVPMPKEYGFDDALTFEGGHGASGHYKEPRNWLRNDATDRNLTYDWTVELYIQEAIRFMEQHKDQPFYLNIWPYTPHEKLDCPQAYKEMYSGRTPAEQIYFGSITHLDHELGKLLDYLEQSGLDQNTVIFFASDNGPESALVPWGPNSRGRTPFRGNKHVLYEGGIRVPGAIRWPGITKPGSVCNEPISTLDLMPTLCKAAGIEPPATGAMPLDGGDFREALRGGTVERRQPLYWQAEFAWAHHMIESPTSKALAIRKGCWKLMSDMSFEDFELYNLDIDPAEHWNLHRKYPARVREMKAELKKIFDEVNGPYSKSAKYLTPDIPNRTVQQHTDSGK
jgi:arylsulfatase A-like enzyme